MADMEIPDESIDGFTVSDLHSFRARRQSEALDTERLHNFDFAHYRLSVWGHPASLAHIIATIEKDLIETDILLTPSIVRLRNMMVDPQFDNISTDKDPYAESFKNAIGLATSEVQLFALGAVQKLHTITLSSELHFSGVDTHIRLIVEAILKSSQD